jgi:hypothetical protein
MRSSFCKLFSRKQSWGGGESKRPNCLMKKRGRTNYVKKTIKTNRVFVTRKKKKRNKNGRNDSNFNSHDINTRTANT